VQECEEPVTKQPLLDPELNRVPQKIKHIHIMGICGTGMAALAGMLKQSGFYISGSDANVYPPMSLFLDRIGITPSSGYGAENLTLRPDLVIVGNTIRADNPEALALAEEKIPYLSFPQALGHFFINGLSSLVVAGTHGKTTTCSLLASALYHAGLDPSFMIGGIVEEFDANFRLGSGPYFISEGDEYDTAFFDKESKFLHYRPKIGIITSVEFDHADIFTDLEAIKRSFMKFVSLFPKDGLLICHLDDPNVRDVVADAPCRVEGYGFDHQNDWVINSMNTDQGLTRFTVLHNDDHWAELSVTMAGRHNCLNSLAVAALLNHIGVESSIINKGLSSFGGVKRRQEVRGRVNGVTVIDDFAHHPTAVKETLSALKTAYPDHRLICVFEPRTNTSRRSLFQQRYVTAFDYGDIILIREPVPLDNVAHSDHFSSARLADDLTARGIDATAFPSTDDILAHLTTILAENDVVAVLSNGGFDNIHDRLLQLLKTLDQK